MAGSLVPLDEDTARRIRRELRGMRRTPIGEVPSDALVMVRGRVACQEPLLAAPITGTPCALYRLDAGEGTTDSRAPAGWSTWWTFPAEARGCDFTVDDGTGVALVRVQDARLSLAGETAAWIVERAVLRTEFLVSRGRRSPQGARHPRIVRYREATLVQGQHVTVLGLSTLQPDPAPAVSLQPYRAAPQICVFSARRPGWSGEPSSGAADSSLFVVE